MCCVKCGVINNNNGYYNNKIVNKEGVNLNRV